MRFKKLWGILVIFFILFITLGVVSAASTDIDDGVISTVGVDNSVGIDDVVIDDNASDIDSGDLGDVSLNSADSNSKSFSDIRSLINNAHSGDTILLDGIYYGDGYSINVNKDLTIKSTSGAILDANALSSIFNVTVSNVYLEGLTFTNGVGTTYAGAINWYGGSGRITGCDFTNNVGVSGGAIYFAKGFNVKILNCNFTNNNASTAGGAIYQCANSSLNVVGCNFIKNTATWNGAAIFLLSEDVVYSSSKGDLANLNVTSSNFIGNFANSGTIAGEYCSVINISNSKFLNNYARNTAGAIFINRNDYSKLTISNSEFTNNSANYGGALHIMATTFIDSCSFNNNTAINIGGAILCCVCNLEVTNSEFNYNAAKLGPAIYNQGVLKITNSNATDDGIMTPIVVDNTYDEDDDPFKVKLDGALVNIRGNPTIYIPNGQKINLTATVTMSGIRVSGGSLTFNIGGAIVNSVDLLNATYIAEYTVTNAVTVSATYTPSKNTKVNKVSIQLPFTTIVSDVYFDKGIDAKMYLATDLDGNLDTDGEVYFKLDNGEWFIGNISGAVASYTFNNVSIGQHNITAKFEEDSKYPSVASTVVVNVNKKSTSIKFNTLNYVYGDNRLEAYIYNSVNNVPLADKVVILTINNKTYSAVSDSDGRVVYTIDILNPASYDVVFNFTGDYYYDVSSLSKVINIAKRSSSINITNISLIYEDTVLDAFIYDSLNNTPLVGENVSLEINDKFYYGISDLDGRVIFNIDVLVPDTYNAIITFTGNSFYNSSSKSVDIIINKKSTYISVNDVLAKYGDTVLEAFIYDVDGNALGNKSVNLNFNGNTLTNISDLDGRVIFNLKDYIPGYYNADLEFLEDDYYAYSSNSSVVSINKLDVNIISSNITAIIGSDVSVIINVSDEKSNKLNDVNITITLPNATEVSIHIIDGVGEYNFIAPDVVGIHMLTLSFNGNEIYNEANTTINLNATKIPVNITLSGSNGYYKSTYVNVKLSEAIENQTITLKLNDGKTTRTVNVKTNTDGVATYCIAYAIGTYTITASSTHENYSFTSNSLKIKVSKATATITPTALTTTYKSGKYFQIKVTNSKKQVMVGVKLKLKVYTGSSYKTVTVTTDSNGIAKYDGSSLSIAKHKIIVSSGESTSYMTATSKTSYITVNKGTTTVSAPAVKNKYQATAYFKITVKNKASGKVISGLSLKVKVYTGSKYTTYTIKTNSGGVASLNTKSLKKGTHKVVITSGSSYYTVSKSGNLITIV